MREFPEMSERDVEAIFLRVLEATDRSAAVRELCGNDRNLRARIESLLQAHEQAGRFFDKPFVSVSQSQTRSNGTTPHDSAEWQIHEEPSVADAKDYPDYLQPCERPDRIGLMGHYEILEEIGRGGMGVVLRGWDTKLHRIVAVKLLAPRLADRGTARQWFLREARSAAAVCHEHVVTIHAVEDGGPLPFLVMECIEGRSLQQRIDACGALSLKEILRIGLQIAQGLAAAHAHGLVHRDIKPANILLENGVERVHITDFGLAQTVDDANVNHENLITGTPPYMSPEQAENGKVDYRSDLFSLGSVLYAMCTGEPAFHAPSVKLTLKRVCEDTPTPIANLNPDIPEWLIAAIDKLLAKQPNDRFASATEVADLLTERLFQLQQGESFPSLVAENHNSPASAAGSVTGNRFVLLTTVFLLTFGFPIAFFLGNSLWSHSRPQTIANSKEIPQNILLSGSKNADVLILTITGPNSATYRLNDGEAIVVRNLSAFAFHGGDGNDTFIVDYNGQSRFATDIVFHGGRQSADGSGDSVTIQGLPRGVTASTIRFLPATEAGNNLIAELDPDGIPVNGDESRIVLHGVEPVALRSPVAHLVVDLQNKTETLTISDDGPGTQDPDSNQDTGHSYLAFRTGDAGLQFANPTKSLVISDKQGARTINVTTPDAEWQADLILEDADRNNTVEMHSELRLNSGNLKLYARTIKVKAGVAVTSNGNIEFNAARNITLHAESSLSTANGSISLVANKARSVSGRFAGINLFKASLTTTDGNIHLSGTGGNTGTGNYGVTLNSKSVVKAGGSGNITILGNGGLSSGNMNPGVTVANGSQLTTEGRDIKVTGVGGGIEPSHTNTGVNVASECLVQTGGMGAVVIHGTGGGGTGDNILGVNLGGKSLLTSSGGMVSVTGHSGKSMKGNTCGVRLRQWSTVSSGGSGNVIVKGVCRAENGPGNYGVKVGWQSTITSGGAGNVLVHGSAGRSQSEHGIIGVAVVSKSTVTSGGTGTVRIEGTGGTCPGSGNHGIYVSDVNTSVRSGGGSVELFGTGGGSGESVANCGIVVNGRAWVIAKGTGNTTLHGIGGKAAKGKNQGVVVKQSGLVASDAGNIDITGTGGGTESACDNHGVLVADSGKIRVGKNGTVTVKGVGGNTYGLSNYGILVTGKRSIITSTDGDVHVIGKAGGTDDTHDDQDVRVESPGRISAGGTVTINGIGQAGEGKPD